MKVTDEHWALAVEVFGGESEAKYMLVGAGLRRDLTVKLLDALVLERKLKTEALFQANNEAERATDAEKELLCQVQAMGDRNA